MIKVEEMELTNTISLEVRPKEAVQLQKHLRNFVKLEPYTGPLRKIAGADISFNKYSPRIYAGFVVLDMKTLKVIDSASAVLDVKFPYIPGLLSFRELPPLYEAWKKLKIRPDVLVLDGQGLAHPRRFGIACHAGLLFDIPTIGCAKSILTGTYKTPGLEAGSVSPLVDIKDREQLGFALRTKNKVNPVFISPGHRMDFESSLKIILQCVGKYRIPEPTRQAHLYVNEVRKADLEKSESQLTLN